MFDFKRLAIPGLILITPKVIGDARGFFMETYKKSLFKQHGISEDFVQDNHSRSVQGVLRGLHFQVAPHAQGKLVRCIFGEIYDVAVDIRPDSSTFGQWYGVHLSAENKLMLYLPAGFAHGFYTISDTAEIVYKTTKEYNQSADGGIVWDDPDIGITWPNASPILSDKDKLFPRLKRKDLS
jgi:dTDP-4-dehydrorhamnose 3,5-epimerase